MNQPTLRFTRSFMGALSLCFALLAGMDLQRLAARRAPNRGVA